MIRFHHSFSEIKNHHQNDVLQCNDNLRLRWDDSTTGDVITTIMKGTKVKVLNVGRRDSSEGVESSWVLVEILSGGKDKNGVPIKEGTKGWCFGGFLESLGNLTSAVKTSGTSYEMAEIPGKDFLMGKTEVTQELYKAVMGENPSGNKGENYPVEHVSMRDAIYFCNKLSVKHGYRPVYTVNGMSDLEKWERFVDVIANPLANGYRLPTKEEWVYAAMGGQNYKYAGSNNIDEVAWYRENSRDTTHPVAQKKPNGYGLYDMSGNVGEWLWDKLDEMNTGIWYPRGGNFKYYASSCTVEYKNAFYTPVYKYGTVGFRLVRNK